MHPAFFVFHDIITGEAANVNCFLRENPIFLETGGDGIADPSPHRLFPRTVITKSFGAVFPHITLLYQRRVKRAPPSRAFSARIVPFWALSTILASARPMPTLLSEAFCPR